MDKIKVAFVCVHNSCRSQMAEAIGNNLFGDFFDCYSAGTETVPKINIDAVITVRNLYGIDMSKQKSKLVSSLPPVAIVVTMGCNVDCPLLPCRHREDWGLNDPTGKGSEESIKTARIIEERLANLKQRIEKNQVNV